MKIVIVSEGDKYGRLTILKENPIEISPCGLRYRTFVCKCECGNKKSYRLGDLRKKGSRRTLSCGCFVKENNKIINTSHGLSYDRIYKIYRSMKNRCELDTCANYSLYGGRGIKCEWDTFEEFYENMGDSYYEHIKLFGEKQTSIDRIETNGNYNNSNCKWATCKEQCRNRRNNRIYLGKTIAEWCEELGLDRQKIDNKLRIKTEKEVFGF